MIYDRDFVLLQHLGTAMKHLFSAAMFLALAFSLSSQRVLADR
jgi:hypothetical protein